MPIFRAKTKKEATTKQRDEFIKEVRGKFGKKDANDKNKVTRNFNLHKDGS